MSKGLEALHHPRIELAKIDISAEGLHDIAYMPFYKTKQYTAIEKELKAFEIANTKDVDIGWLKRAKDLSQYNSGMGVNSYSALTQEEYRLLKEELL